MNNGSRSRPCDSSPLLFQPDGFVFIHEPLSQFIPLAASGRDFAQTQEIKHNLRVNERIWPAWHVYNVIYIGGRVTVVLFV